MSRFKVWLRPVGQATKVQAEGRQNSDWLRARMVRHGFACTPSESSLGAERFTFRAGHSAGASRPAVHELLAGLPDVTLMHSPE